MVVMGYIYQAPALAGLNLALRIWPGNGLHHQAGQEQASGVHLPHCNLSSQGQLCSERHDLSTDRGGRGSTGSVLPHGNESFTMEWVVCIHSQPLQLRCYTISRALNRVSPCPSLPDYVREGDDVRELVCMLTLG